LGFVALTTVLRVGGMRCRHLSDDRRPAKADKALAQIASDLSGNIELLCKKWEEVHGHY
jgi:hypothetical protein